MKSLFKTSFKYFLYLMMFLLGWQLLAWVNFLRQPLPITTPQVFNLSQGSSIRRVANELTEQGILIGPYRFEILARVTEQTRRLQVGEYSITPGMTALELLHMINRGEVIQHEYTVIEGWNFAQMMAALSKLSDVKQTLSGKSPQDMMLLISGQTLNPEGLFYPDTYHYAKNATDLDILKRAYQAMQTKFEQAWAQRDPRFPLKDPYQVFILASLVEKETALQSERPEIAAVLLNRLQLNMPLQIDPTVIYALGDQYTGKLTKQDMKISSPYNTYLHKGLPPSPIAMPSLNAINAVLHPANSDALYFVAKGDGSHVFSRSLEQHDVAIRNYLLNKPAEAEPVKSAK